MRIAAGVEYCGHGFTGWQSQPGQRTVQATVEAALGSIADRPVQVQCAGRTDAGVHAIQQVIHYDSDAVRSLRSWVLGANSALPPDVSLLWALPVPDEFSSRFSAQSRRYRYLILNRPVRTAIGHRLLTYERRHLDETLMATAATDLIGEHDFTSYRAVSCQSKSPVRRVTRLEVTRNGDLIILDIEANAFLHHMVRNIAGVLMAIGRGAQGRGWAREVLHARDRTLGGMTAPPDGLYLMDVGYPDRYRIPAARDGMPIMRLFGPSSGRDSSAHDHQNMRK